jgi:hypothetical protein
LTYDAGGETTRAVLVGDDGVQVFNEIPDNMSVSASMYMSRDTFFSLYLGDIHPRQAILSGQVSVPGFAFRQVYNFGISFDSSTAKWNEFYAHKREQTALAAASRPSFSKLPLLSHDHTLSSRTAELTLLDSEHATSPDSSSSSQWLHIFLHTPVGVQLLLPSAFNSDTKSYAFATHSSFSSAPLLAAASMTSAFRYATHATSSIASPRAAAKLRSSFPDWFSGASHTPHQKRANSIRYLMLTHAHNEPGRPMRDRPSLFQKGGDFSLFDGSKRARDRLRSLQELNPLMSAPMMRKLKHNVQLLNNSPAVKETRKLLKHSSVYAFPLFAMHPDAYVGEFGSSKTGTHVPKLDTASRMSGRLATRRMRRDIKHIAKWVNTHKQDVDKRLRGPVPKVPIASYPIEWLTFDNWS